MNCPKCDEEMEHEDYDPSVGMMNGGWFCEACDYFIDDSDAPDDYDDRGDE